MDDKTERKRLRHLEAVKKYFAAHKDEIKNVGMTWPVKLLKRIDEAAARAGVSRQAWVFQTCEEALEKLAKSRKR